MNKYEESRMFSCYDFEVTLKYATCEAICDSLYILNRPNFYRLVSKNADLVYDGSGEPVFSF